MMDDDLRTVDDVAYDTNVDAQRIRGMARRHEIPAIKVKNVWLLPPDAVEKVRSLTDDFTFDRRCLCDSCRQFSHTLFFKKQYLCRDCLCRDTHKSERRGFSILALAREV